MLEQQYKEAELLKKVLLEMNIPEQDIINNMSFVLFTDWFIFCKKSYSKDYPLEKSS